LTKALAVAWAAEGIRVNAIAPGWISTEMTRGLVEDEGRSAAMSTAHPCNAGVNLTTLAARLCFFVPPQHVSSPGRSCR
jgi:NAD(P)-dependent dehydrogenase (short-subunit alcohol dehydrogenase family)